MTYVPHPNHVAFWANPNDPRHGTANGYQNLRCKCSRCTHAWAVHCRARKARRLARPIPEHVHGTDNGYRNYDCRCRLCTDASWRADTRNKKS